MGRESRQRLGHQQRDLLAALVLGGPEPPGFDPSRIAAGRRQLAEKRWRNLGKERPALVRSLGPDGASRFLAYAATNPLPAGGARADGARFCERAVRKAELNDEALVEHLRVSAWLRRHEMGVMRRWRLYVAALPARAVAWRR